MNIDFIIKNFRVFDNEGTFVSLRPITVLTGCNNSGKSSITKALCLLKDFSQQLEADFAEGRILRLERYKMDFHKSVNSIMGSFDLVLHHDKKANNDVTDSEKPTNSEFITFQILVKSSWLLQDVILELEFCSLADDELNDGYLHACSIKTLDDKLIYHAIRNGQASMDFSMVKKSLLHFLCGQHAFSSWQGAANYENAIDGESSETVAAGKLYDAAVNNIGNELGVNALIRMLEWQVSNGPHAWKDQYTSYAKSILESPVERSFVLNGPLLGVYCYFPCLELFKDVQKTDVRKVIHEKIESLENPIEEMDRKIIDSFLSFFEKSTADTLHEYISQKENEKFFVDSKIRRIGGIIFGVPKNVLKTEINTDLYYGSGDLNYETWSLALTALNLINKLMMGTDQDYVNFDEINMCRHYYKENLIDDYLKKVIEDILAHMLPGTLTYSPTTIVESRRLYSVEDNSQFSNTLKEYFNAVRLWDQNKRSQDYWLLYGKKEPYKPCAFINKWMRLLGIAHHVEIRSQVGGYGVSIHLYDDENDDVGMLLADKGFGVVQLFVILLKIETAVITTKLNDVLYVNYTSGLNKDFAKKYLRPHSKLYPITVAMEEPECHLHPSLQSKFAEMIADASKEHGVHFIIESHSEYFIRNLQLMVSQDRIKGDEISLLYVNPVKRPSHLPAITDIGINKDGTLKNEFGTGFLDEALRLSKELFKKEHNDDEK